MKAETVCRKFGIDGKFLEQKQLSSGNINTTFTVLFLNTEGSEEKYVVQRINGYVFKDPAQIMSNIELVTAHIRKKLVMAGENPSRRVLQFLHGEDGKNFCRDEAGDVWRVYHYIPNSVALHATGDLTILRSSGAAFGQFQKNLLDFDASCLQETIQDFHNTPKRLDCLFASAERDELARKKDAEALLAYIRERRGPAERLIHQAEAGELPLRVTHNDTKCNNVLFDRDTGEALAVIDLDTIMSGLMAYDFGDAVRSAANTAAEDEPDLSRVSFDLARFTAFAEGFIGTLGDAMTAAELDSMALGAYAMTVELASRFLEDYLTGDHYFAVKYPKHNLVRAACQVALARDIEGKLPQMQEIVERIYSETRL